MDNKAHKIIRRYLSPQKFILGGYTRWYLHGSPEMHKIMMSSKVVTQTHIKKFQLLFYILHQKEFGGE